MFTRRALGIIALAAVILAAVSFAVVDVSIADANGCIGDAEPCADESLPTTAIVFAIIGTVALLVSLFPAIRWFSGAIHLPHHEHEHDAAVRARIRRPVYEEDEL